MATVMRYASTHVGPPSRCQCSSCQLGLQTVRITHHVKLHGASSEPVSRLASESTRASWSALSDGEGDAARANLRRVLGEVRLARGWDSKDAEGILRKLEGQLAACFEEANLLGLDDAEWLDAQKQRRELHNELVDLRGQLRVCCRVRPLTPSERATGVQETLTLEDSGMRIRLPNGKQFALDGVFGPESSQAEVFEDFRPLVQSVVDGHSVALLAYGQTGSGKTHTMYGSLEDEGLAFRAVDELFRLLAQERAGTWRVALSFLELYNGDILDLLERIPEDDTKRRKLTLRAGETGIEVVGLTVRETSSSEELQRLLLQATARRVTSAHATNPRSSRSHALCEIRLARQESAKASRTSGTSRLLLCDLGGCERIKNSGVTGAQRREAIEINRSLCALRGVVQALTKGSKQVPYRESKLTLLLQSALAGSGKTCMVVTCSPGKASLEETENALRFANCASLVVQKKPETRSKAEPEGGA